jgi:hypothetical protein
MIRRTTESLYQAGLSAHHSGNAEIAKLLLREALWLDPGHRLAAQAKEAIQ